MKLNLLLLISLPIAMYAQDSLSVDNTMYPNTFSSGSAKVAKFDNKARGFNDWAISVGGGGAFMQSGDLTSFYDGKVDAGWNAYASIDKQITHAFGVNLQYQMGKTNQKGILPGALGVAAGVATAWTKYQQISLNGDVNFSNLLRRVDNNSPYRWALHGYGGVGIMSYNTLLLDNDKSRYSTIPKRVPIIIEQKLGIASFFFQAGTGVKYKLSKLVDIEARVMYIVSGDDEFDGGGPDHFNSPYYNLINDTYTDNMFTANLGLTFKLGKNISHLAWHDPLVEAYYKVDVLEKTPAEFIVCDKGDRDNDGVCDDWDRQLDTPTGARVDGAGVALDLDLDGVIDLYDKCVTVPGPVENNGCPTATTAVSPTLVDNGTTITEINKEFEGIVFELNSDKIRPESFQKLDQAAEIIKILDANSKFAVIGATDTRGSADANLSLSQRRANSVVKYLTNKGVSSGMLSAEGHGEADLKYPECEPATKCPEWKNEANRRVYFQQK